MGSDRPEERVLSYGLEGRRAKKSSDGGCRWIVLGRWRNPQTLIGWVWRDAGLGLVVVGKLSYR